MKIEGLGFREDASIKNRIFLGDGKGEEWRHGCVQ